MPSVFAYVSYGFLTPHIKLILFQLMKHMYILILASLHSMLIRMLSLSVHRSRPGKGTVPRTST